MSPLAISWVLSSISGYGIYGLQIVLQYLRRGGEFKDIILTNDSLAVVMPPLTQPRIDPCLALGKKLSKFLAENPQETLALKHAVLHGSSTDFNGFPGQTRILGEPNVACTAFEHLVCSEHGREVSKIYDIFIAISRWNADYLKSLNIGPVHLCYQGIDPELFHPAPGSGLYKDRFVIFSGGKFEYRKSQDIVVAAFKHFFEKHPDALLVTCWQSLIAPDAEAFANAGLCNGVPEVNGKQGLHITPWLLKQGLPPESFIDLPFTLNLLMPTVLHDCDMAVFPNRCEGGTNLVAMEAAACGVPTYVANNTGQKDLVEFIDFPAFRHQGLAKGSSQLLTVEGWGETDVDEVVAAMEDVYAHRDAARRDAAVRAERMKEWAWGPLNEKLLKVVLE